MLGNTFSLEVLNIDVKLFPTDCWVNRSTQLQSHKICTVGSQRPIEALIFFDSAQRTDDPSA